MVGSDRGLSLTLTEVNAVPATWQGAVGVVDAPTSASCWTKRDRISRRKSIQLESSYLINAPGTIITNGYKGFARKCMLDVERPMLQIRSFPIGLQYREDCSLYSKPQPCNFHQVPDCDIHAGNSTSLLIRRIETDLLEKSSI